MRYVIAQNSFCNGHSFKAAGSHGYTWSSIVQAEIFADLFLACETANAIRGRVIPYTEALKIVEFEQFMKICGLRR